MSDRCRPVSFVALADHVELIFESAVTECWDAHPPAHVPGVAIPRPARCRLEPDDPAAH